MEGISNILKCGQENFAQAESNPFADAFEACGGLDALEEL